MEIETKKEQIWRQFLLGKVAGPERIAIEDGFMTDEDNFAALEIMESELIEDYLSDELNAHDRVLFESAYMKSSARRSRVERMKVLIDEASARKRFAVSSDHQVPWGQKIAVFFKHAGWRTVVAASAFVLLAIAGVWFLNRQDNNPERAASVESVPPPAPLSSPAVEVPQREDNSNENASRAEIKPAPSPTPKKGAPPEREIIMAILVLSPGGVRGSSTENRLRVTQQTSEIRLRLELETENYATYTARVTSIDGKTIFTSQRLKSNKKSVLLQFPIRGLPRGDYIVELAGINSAGLTESVNDYTFSLER